MANQIITTSITCAGGLPAFVATPSAPTKVPVIVLLHERYGLVQHSKDLACRFAQAGYICIAADYFFKHPDQEALHRGDSGYKMTDPESLTYMNAAIEAVAQFPQADLSRLAVKGVCQTGRHPLVLAAHRKISAALVWYGAAQTREWEVTEQYPVSLDEIMDRVDCPVLGMFGEGDHIISVDHVRRFRAALERTNKTYHVEIFGGAPHGWLNDTMPGRYRAQQALAAWNVQLDFLARVFGPPSPFIMQSYRAAISPNYDFSKNVRYE